MPKNQNCYAYALDYHMPIDPGELSGQKYRDNHDDGLIRAAENDGLEFAGKDVVPERRFGKRIVALFATNSDSQNYHWIREERDGTWSHKPGQGTVSKKDARDADLDRGNLPHQADFNFKRFFEQNQRTRRLLSMAEQQGWAIHYDRFVGYFYCPSPYQPPQSTCTIL